MTIWLLRAMAHTCDKSPPSQMLVICSEKRDLDMRNSLDRKILRELMKELARSSPRGDSYKIYLIGGGTAVLRGWRESTIDADLHSDHPAVFKEIQRIKEHLQLNIEFVRPEDFVPALCGSDGRHVFIETIGRVSFYHYDPYSQLLSKVVRAFRRDILDAKSFISEGMVDKEVFRTLVQEIPDSEYSRYPSISRNLVQNAVESFLAKT
jgi:hypothetical protein